MPRKRRKLPEFFRRDRPDGTKSPILWTRIGGRRVSTHTTNLKAAKRWKERKLIERADPRRAAAETATLADAIRAMYAELRRRGRSEATQQRARQKLGHFPRLWGEDCKLASIDAARIAEYIDTRLEEPGLGKAKVQRITIRDELAFLRQLLKLARHHGKYPYAIDDVMPILFETGHKPKKTWCKERNFPKLLRAVYVHDRRAHLAWLVATGSRLSESLRARPEDVNLETYAVLIRGSKTEGSWQTIIVPSRLRRWLRYALKHALSGERATLFDDWTNIRRDMHEACKRAGIPEVGPHDLRRTFGKWLRLHGFDLETIAKLLRHTTPKLAREVYADVDGAELAQVVEQQERQAAKSRDRKGTGDDKT